ncbi:MAG TPA: response regulator transcription factor [Labilithrix sp.]|nr:response regulator transcription factor [Labilithrix sp.]
MTRLRVLIADDHAMVRSGLRALIDAEPDMVTVGDAGDGLDAVRLANELRPDVVLMDISMPRLNGTAATERLKQEGSPVKVLVLTAHEEPGFVQALLRAGAAGYVYKRAAAAELVRAIRTVAAGGAMEHATDAPIETADEQAAPTSEPTEHASLSERESEVIRFVAQGHAMKEIASRLELSTRTVETYKTRAMEKLGCKTRADIVRYALRRGWLRPD